MRIFVYEHLCGGGLLNEAVAALRPLLCEARAMNRAVAADFAAVPGVEVVQLRDSRLDDNLPAAPVGVQAVPVSTADEHAKQFDELVATNDAVLLIAPETDGLLTSLARRVERLGGRLLSPSSDFCAWASDKSQVAETLAAAGAPVPFGRRLAAEDPWPRDFPFPAVLKPNDGCGAQHTYRITNPDEDRRSSDHAAWRIERFVPGTPVSVSFVAGPQTCLMLCAGRQDVRCDGRFKYFGGTCPLTLDLNQRVIDLLQRCWPAVPDFTGYIGVDAVLGSADDGSEDYLIEINPRITTSYVGQRELFRNNLAEVMLDVHAGREVRLDARVGSLSFNRNGEVTSVLEE